MPRVTGIARKRKYTHPHYPPGYESIPSQSLAKKVRTRTPVAVDFETPERVKRSGNMDLAKRSAIYFYWFRTLDAPGREDWYGRDGVIRVIVQNLNLPVGSFSR